MIVTTLGSLALGLSLMVAGQPRTLIQRVDLRISQVEPEESPKPEPPSDSSLPNSVEEETYVDEHGNMVTLDDIVSECTTTEDVACEGNRCGHFWSRPRSGYLAAFLGKFRSAWSFSHSPFRLRAPSFHRSLFARHSSCASPCSCGDVGEETCCGEESCDELPSEKAVVSTSEPCPACMHVVAPMPPKVTPISEGPIAPSPVPANEDAPSLPTKDVSAEPANEGPIKEELNLAPPKRSIEDDIPTRPIPTESTSLSVGLTEVVPTSFEDLGPHAADFSWIVGELGYQHSRGGVWTVRYLPLDQSDAHGGQVILNKDPRLAEFKEGDTVRIEGRISKRSTIGPPTYRITAISKAE